MGRNCSQTCSAPKTARSMPPSVGGRYRVGPAVSINSRYWRNTAGLNDIAIPVPAMSVRQAARSIFA